MVYKLRTQQIIIDIPRTNSEPWINVKVQRIVLDNLGNEGQIIDRWGSINKKLSIVATEIHNYFEALPVSTPQISIYGISDAIKVVAITWIAEKYGGSIINDEVIVSI